MRANDLTNACLNGMRELADVIVVEVLNDALDVVKREIASLTHIDRTPTQDKDFACALQDCAALMRIVAYFSPPEGKDENASGNT